VHCTPTLAVALSASKLLHYQAVDGLLPRYRPRVHEMLKHRESVIKDQKVTSQNMN
jgi:acetylglutamate kinase